MNGCFSYHKHNTRHAMHKKLIRFQEFITILHKKLDSRNLLQI